jgi:hypothetical protein
MDVSTSQEMILERIGHTLADLNEDMAIEALPKQMVALLDPSLTHQSDETNTICALVETLMHSELYRFFDRDSELFLQPIQPHAAPV